MGGEVNKSELGFAPEAPSDARPIGEWKTRYAEREAQLAIRTEFLYLIGLFGLHFLLLFLLWANYLTSWLGLVGVEVTTFKCFVCSILGGMFGGTLFSMKWLYHTVAKNIWNRDRRLWRLLTPLLSLGLSFGFVALIYSDIVKLFNPELLQRPIAVYGLGFIVGYFSDSAAAKLAEISATIFGVQRDRQ